jgi:hypothetical protein
MSKLNAFKEELTKGYTFKKDSITIGGAMLDGVGVPGLHVKVPLKTLNRHGLIAGATGTGKTKTLQVFAEQLSQKGIPSLLMDIKGDLSGLAAPGVRNDFIAKRHAAIELPYEPKPMPVGLMTLTEGDGVKLKASENYPITEFYKTDEIITKLGIGEALVTALNEKGIPTPLAVTICRAPLTRMGILEKSEVKNLVENSDLVRKYGEEIDRESAYEILNKKLEKAANAEEQEKKHETIDKEIAELKKAEDKRLAAKEKELARLKREQVKTEREKEKNQEKFWKDISRAATRKTRDTSLFGTLARGILGVLGVK